MWLACNCRSQSEGFVRSSRQVRSQAAPRSASARSSDQLEENQWCLPHSWNFVVSWLASPRHSRISRSVGKIPNSRKGKIPVKSNSRNASSVEFASGSRDKEGISSPRDLLFSPRSFFSLEYQLRSASRLPWELPPTHVPPPGSRG